MIYPLKIFAEQTRFYQELLTSKNMQVLLPHKQWNCFWVIDDTSAVLSDTDLAHAHYNLLDVSNIVRPFNKLSLAEKNFQDQCFKNLLTCFFGMLWSAIQMPVVTVLEWFWY